MFSMVLLISQYVKIGTETQWLVVKFSREKAAKSAKLWFAILMLGVQVPVDFWWKRVVQLDSVV